MVIGLWWLGSSTQKDLSSAPLAPVANVSAAQLFKTYAENEVAADRDFNGKSFTVTGWVHQVRKDFLGDVILEVRGKKNSLDDVWCYFPEDRASQVANLKPGQGVSVGGVGKGMTLDTPMMRDCKLISYSPEG